jgi:hypothetical protein
MTSVAAVMRPTLFPVTSPPMMMVSPTVVMSRGVMATMTVSIASMMSAMAGPMSRVLAVPGPFVPAIAVTPFATFMTCRSLSVIAAPAVLGMLASPVLPALGKLASAALLALGKFVSFAVLVPSAARPRRVIGLLAMFTPIVAAFSVVPPIAFVACIATIKCSRLATLECSRLATVVRGAIATVVRQFVRSDLVARRQTPVKTGRKLHQDGSCKSSHKHQHAISHPTAPSPDSRRGFSRG